MLANGTRVSNVNVLMGWSDKSTMWQPRARQAQLASVQLARVIDPTEIQRTIDAAASAKPIEPWWVGQSVGVLVLRRRDAGLSSPRCVPSRPQYTLSNSC